MIKYLGLVSGSRELSNQIVQDFINFTSCEDTFELAEPGKEYEVYSRVNLKENKTDTVFHARY